MHFYLKYCIPFPYKTKQKVVLQKFWNIPLFFICLLKNNEVLSIKTRIFTLFFIMMVSVIAHFNITEYIFIIMKNLGNLQKEKKMCVKSFCPRSRQQTWFLDGYLDIGAHARINLCIWSVKGIWSDRKQSKIRIDRQKNRKTVCTLR